MQFGIKRTRYLLDIVFCSRSSRREYSFFCGVIQFWPAHGVSEENGRNKSYLSSLYEHLYEFGQNSSTAIGDLLTTLVITQSVLD